LQEALFALPSLKSFFLKYTPEPERISPWAKNPPKTRKAEVEAFTEYLEKLPSNPQITLKAGFVKN